MHMHEIIAAALASLGIEASLQAAAKEQESPLCFQHITPGDVCVAGAKVVGSAQRQRDITATTERVSASDSGTSREGLMPGGPNGDVAHGYWMTSSRCASAQRFSSW